MARTAKYDWPDDQKLQALLDEHGTAETARLVGCPPSSLSNRIRRRGLKGAKQRRKPDAANANGTPDAVKPNLEPDQAPVNGTPDAAKGNGKADKTKATENPDATGPSAEPVREKRNPSEGPTRTRMRETFEYLGSADYRVRRETRNPAANGKPDETSAREKPETGPTEKSVHEKRKPSEESIPTRVEDPLERLGSADYRVRRKPENPAEVKAGSGKDDTADQRSKGRSADERQRENQAARVETSGVAAFPVQASAQRVSRPKRRGPALLRRVARLPRRVPPTIWRSLAVLALAAVAGIAAFISVSNDPKTYERETSFAVRPSSDVPPAAVNDVLGTLAQPDSAITETIVNMLGSPRLRDFAAQSAGVPATSVGASGAEYVWSATRRAGSTIIDVRLTGPDDDKLLAMQTAAAPEAARLVEESYSPYRLETLSAPSPPVQVGPKVARTVGLAVLLGTLLGITLVLVERRLRSSLPQREGPARAPAERGEPWEH
jgi:capsular polysaccharide biosynthesis protein